MWGNAHAFSKDCGKRCWLSISPSFPPSSWLLGFFFGFLGLLDSVAGDIEFENHAVVNQAINRCCSLGNAAGEGSGTVSSDFNYVTAFAFSLYQPVRYVVVISISRAFHR